MLKNYWYGMEREGASLAKVFVWNTIRKTSKQGLLLLDAQCKLLPNPPDQKEINRVYRQSEGSFWMS